MRRCSTILLWLAKSTEVLTQSEQLAWSSDIMRWTVLPELSIQMLSLEYRIIMQ